MRKEVTMAPADEGSTAHRTNGLIGAFVLYLDQCVVCKLQTALLAELGRGQLSFTPHITHMLQCIYISKMDSDYSPIQVPGRRRSTYPFTVQTVHSVHSIVESSGRIAHNSALIGQQHLCSTCKASRAVDGKTSGAAAQIDDGYDTRPKAGFGNGG